jgi:hypothetical protein
MTDAASPLSRAERRRSAAEQRIRREEQRWSRHRLAVPHRTDGPKVTLGLAWFLGLVAATVWAPLVGVFVLPASAIAALQTAHAWARSSPVDRQLAAAAAFLVAAPALTGSLFWLGVGIVVGVVAICSYAGAVVAAQGADPIRFAELMVRSSLPVGIAAGSLLYLAVQHRAPFIALVLMVSAYEAGDFLIGSEAGNDLEGPIAGLVALGLVGFGVWLVPPDPLTSDVVPYFCVLTAVACPLGQVFASGLLPRGSDWAPGLRRLDSYLIAAVLWALLV